MCAWKRAAFVIKTSHKHDNIVDNLPLASWRAIHPSVCASKWLHIPEMPLCWGGSEYPPAPLASLCSPCTSKYFGSCLLYLAEGAVTSHPQTASPFVLQSFACRFHCHSGTAKARVGGSFCCPNSMWNLARQGSIPEWHIPEWAQWVSTQERVLQLQDIPCGRKAALDIQKWHTHTHCWFSQVYSAGSAPAVCCFEKRSVRNICWI